MCLLLWTKTCSFFLRKQQYKILLLVLASKMLTINSKIIKTLYNNNSLARQLALCTEEVCHLISTMVMWHLAYNPFGSRYQLTSRCFVASWLRDINSSLVLMLRRCMSLSKDTRFAVASFVDYVCT